MKKNFPSFLFCLSILLLVFQSCKSKPRTASQSLKTETSDNILDTFKSSLRPDENLALGKTYTDTIHFVEFNDDGDYRLLIAKKNKDTIGLIYDSEYNFIRGDEIEIDWKMDSIRYAGDPEFLNFAEFLISAKQLKPLSLADKKVKFLWRETRYNEEYKTDINTIVLNENFIKNISEPEKAALAYVATFIGNECQWDGNANDDRSNLKCKILSALDLGYQCSRQHLDFLRFWFRSNKDVLKELEQCPTIPDGATIQSTFDEINLEVESNVIIVSFKASAINVRESISKEWEERRYFKFKQNELTFIKKDISEATLDTFDVYGN